MDAVIEHFAIEADDMQESDVSMLVKVEAPLDGIGRRRNREAATINAPLSTTRQ